MKTWQTYTLIGFAAAITLMQAWTTYLTVQSMAGVPIKAMQYLKKKEINNKLNSYTSIIYYWRVIPKNQLTEEYVQKEADDLVKEVKGNADRETIEDNLHQLLDPVLNDDEEYVGTLYETEDDVVIAIKKTETNYIGPEDSFYTDPNNPEDCDPFK